MNVSTVKSCGTLLGFDARDDARGGMDSSGKFHEGKLTGVAEAQAGIGAAKYDGIMCVVKPVEAFLNAIYTQYNGNGFSALKSYMSVSGTPPNKNDYEQLSNWLLNNLYIEPDVNINDIPYLFMRDDNGKPVPKPAVNDFDPVKPASRGWRCMISHTSTASAKGVVGRVLRCIAYYHHPWQFQLRWQLHQTSCIVNADDVRKFMTIAGEDIGIGAGRTKAEHITLRGETPRPKGRFIVIHQ